MTIGEIILSLVNFLIFPAWHLVVLYVVLLLATAYFIYDNYFLKNN